MIFEIFSFSALEKAAKECKDIKDREHVTFYFWKYNKGFKTGQFSNSSDWSKYRITVDYPEDFEVISSLLTFLDQKKKFGSLDEVIDIINSNDDLLEKNKKYFFGQGW